MKLRALINEDGELVAATSGSIGLPQDMAGVAKEAKHEPVVGIMPGPGQTICEIDVPDDFLDVNRTGEFHRYVMDSINR
jgi:hypothetical protein